MAYIIFRPNGSIVCFSIGQLSYATQTKPFEQFHTEIGSEVGSGIITIVFENSVLPAVGKA